MRKNQLLFTVEITDTYMEGPTVQCAYTGLPIESAHGDPEENVENAD